MTVHLISVGISMLESMKHPARKGLSTDLSQAFDENRPFSTLTFGFTSSERETASQWAAGALTSAGEPGHDPDRARQLRDIAGELDIDQWPSNISAEIETFRAQRESHAFPLSQHDIAMLICSDTPEGLLAGTWNALRLTGGDFSRTRFLPEPGMDMGKVRGKAVIARVTGMDAANPDGFRNAMSGLGTLACRLFETRCLTENDDFRFYLSGGFKAAIPYLIGMAEALRSLDGKRLTELGAAKLSKPGEPFPVKAFVLHELTEPRVPIELPLRRLPAAAIREELAGYTGSTRRTKPESTLLEGYAYERNPGGRDYTLTPFGAGLQALFSIPPEGFGR